jgi:hypothetical protein
MLGLAAGTVAGCATITKGTTQSIDIQSDPAGAHCALTREGAQLGPTTTPGAVTITLSRKPVSVLCTKEGYEEGRAVMNAEGDPARYGNLIYPFAAGLIGGAVDRSTGAASRYQPLLRIVLTPLSPADQPSR